MCLFMMYMVLRSSPSSGSIVHVNRQFCYNVLGFKKDKNFRRAKCWAEETLKQVLSPLLSLSFSFFLSQDEGQGADRRANAVCG